MSQHVINIVLILWTSSPVKVHFPHIESSVHFRLTTFPFFLDGVMYDLNPFEFHVVHGMRSVSSPHMAEIECCCLGAAGL